MTENSTTQVDSSPSDIRIKVGVHDDPADALRDVLDDPETEALQLHRESDRRNSHVTLHDGGLWGIAERDDGELVEGSMDRSRVMDGLAAASQVSVVPADDVPFIYEKRNGYGLTWGPTDDE